jgi:hypothetical protein
MQRNGSQWLKPLSVKRLKPEIPLACITTLFIPMSSSLWNYHTLLDGMALHSNSFSGYPWLIFQLTTRVVVGYPRTLTRTPDPTIILN